MRIRLNPCSLCDEEYRVRLIASPWGVGNRDLRPKAPPIVYEAEMACGYGSLHFGAKRNRTWSPSPEIRLCQRCLDRILGPEFLRRVSL